MKKRNIIISYILGIALSIFLIWAYRTNENDLKKLKTEGRKARGVITKVVDRKRGVDFKYKFWVNNKAYKSWEKTYKSVMQGDTIEITYYLKDPSINKPEVEIK